MPAIPDMTYAQLLHACQQAQCKGEEIGHGTARAIASLWHGGQGTRLYALASTGSMAGTAHELWSEVAAEYPTASQSDRLMLDMIGTYLVRRELDSASPEGEAS